MSESQRERVLARIRAAVVCGPSRTESDGGPAERMGLRPVGPRPQLGADPLERFVAKAQDNLFTIERIASLQLLAPSVAALFSGSGDVPDISVAPALAHLGWPAEWRINSGMRRRVEPLCVTLAVAGIAETGSVVLRSDPSSPTSLNFLPDTHVVVLRTSDIVAYPEDVWSRLRAGGEDWPRAVNIISGPSRTADVGGTIVRPAHGPKAVHLVLLDG